MISPTARVRTVRRVRVSSSMSRACWCWPNVVPLEEGLALLAAHRRHVIQVVLTCGGEDGRT
jgi:hypothetical protein